MSCEQSRDARPLPVDVRQFLEEFQAASSRGDASAVGALFADVFLSADPNRAIPVSREALIAALPKRERLFAAAGLSHAALDFATHTDLDQHHVLLNTRWTMMPADPESGRKPLGLHSTFLLRRDAGKLSVVAYLNHQDLAAIGTPTARH